MIFLNGHRKIIRPSLSCTVLASFACRSVGGSTLLLSVTNQNLFFLSQIYCTQTSPSLPCRAWLKHRFTVFIWLNRLVSPNYLSMPLQSASVNLTETIFFGGGATECQKMLVFQGQVGKQVDFQIYELPSKLMVKTCWIW